jgi:DNA-directed RNA polymerase specialized sigma24 family protein
MTHDEEARLVHAARAGDHEALKSLIRAADSNDLVAYADDVQKYSKIWDTDDIVALMREIVWRLIMCPDGKRGYDPSIGSLRPLAWKCLKNAILNQIKYEGRILRGGNVPHCSIEDTWHIDKDDETSHLRPDGLSLEIGIDIDRVRATCSPAARLVIGLLIEGLNFGEIVSVMRTPTSKWTRKKLRELVQGEIRLAIEPIRHLLREETSRSR